MLATAPLISLVDIVVPFRREVWPSSGAASRRYVIRSGSRFGLGYVPSGAACASSWRARAIATLSTRRNACVSSSRAWDRASWALEGRMIGGGNSVVSFAASGGNVSRSSGPLIGGCSRRDGEWPRGRRAVGVRLDASEADHGLARGVVDARGGRLSVGKLLGYVAHVEPHSRGVGPWGPACLTTRGPRFRLAFRLHFRRPPDHVLASKELAQYVGR